jgi:hypothetical protein
MLKTAFVAACVLAVSGGVALAQSQLQGPSNAPYGANGPAERSVGGDPNVNHTWNGATSSSSMRNAELKAQSARAAQGAPTAQPSRY